MSEQSFATNKNRRNQPKTKSQNHDNIQEQVSKAENKKKLDFDMNILLLMTFHIL